MRLVLVAMVLRMVVAMPMALMVICEVSMSTIRALPVAWSVRV